jgi:AcrR family transcriptional regulator
MFTHKNQSWLFAGYELFAEKGPEGLKIEVLAQKVGISKSSFYHHFADLELFTDFLLKYYLDQAKRMAATTTSHFGTFQIECIRTKI